MWNYLSNLSIPRGLLSVRQISANGSAISLASNYVASGSLVPVMQTTCQCTSFNATQNVISRFYGTLTNLSGGTWRASSPGTLLTVKPAESSFWSNSGESGLLGGSYYIQTRGMKYKGRVKRRCKDCFLMWINGMLYNLCKTHPRHKHALKPAYFENQRILTHATMGPKRPW